MENEKVIIEDGSNKWKEYKKLCDERGLCHWRVFDNPPHATYEFISFDNGEATLLYRLPYKHAETIFGSTLLEGLSALGRAVNNEVRRLFNILEMQEREKK